MMNLKTIQSILKEYGFEWCINRVLYILKLKTIGIFPSTERWYEKKTSYPKRLDLFQIDVQLLKSFLRDRLSDEDKNYLLQAANNACEGKITVFSSFELDYGNPIDWQLNPLTGKSCRKDIKWYKIPDFDKERGDIKVVWEISRFSHFITLARAFVLTNDIKYYSAFSGQLSDWIENNAYGFGANYKCGQECSFRMVNALLAYSVFKNCGVVVPVDTGNMKCLVDRCYRKVLGNFFYAYKCVKNNHTISELMGMIVGACCCEDEKRITRAYELLNEVIDEQFYDDGGYKQFSFNYQRLALQDLECVLALSAVTGRQLSKNCIDKIRKSAWLMYQCQDENGDMPNYGSNDGALVFPVTACGYRDFTPVINTIYSLTTGKQLYRDGKHQEELIWFSGGKALREYEFLEANRESGQFMDAGLFTLRNRDSWAMIVSNDYKTRPAHMDQNHIDLWIEGVNVLCDGGTYSYASELGRKLVSNESHNTVVIDGKSQMSLNGPFMIYGWTKRILNTCDNETYEGIITSANGYHHFRKVKKTISGYEITDLADTDYCIMFHTPCEVKTSVDTVYLLSNGMTICKIHCSAAVVVQESQRSLLYLKSEPIKCLAVIEQAGKEVKTIITIKEDNIYD